MRKGLIADIFAAYGGLRASMEQKLRSGAEESRLLFLVSFASLIRFIAGIPQQVNNAARSVDDPSALDIPAVLGAHFMATMVMGVIAFYLFAGITHFIAKRLGGQGDYFSARFAMFWALCVASPLVLLGGVINAVSLGADIPQLAFFLWAIELITLWIWANCFAAAEKYGDARKVFAVSAGILAAIAAVVYGLAA